MKLKMCMHSLCVNIQSIIGVRLSVLENIWLLVFLRKYCNWWEHLITTYKSCCSKIQCHTYGYCSICKKGSMSIATHEMIPPDMLRKHISVNLHIDFLFLFVRSLPFKTYQRFFSLALFSFSEKNPEEQEINKVWPNEFQNSLWSSCCAFLLWWPWPCVVQ